MKSPKTPKRAARKAKPRFDVAASLDLAAVILAEPPARGFIKRPKMAPTVVFRAVLPASICKEANATLRRAFASSKWAHAANKEKIWKCLSAQAKPWRRYQWAWPLNLEGGRPQVIAIKFSSGSNDEGSNPAKAAIDMLTCRKLLNKNEQRYTTHRLGIIQDDRRSAVDQFHWWEFLPKKHAAFVLIEVRV